jgi:hypothetical protein
MVAAGSSGSRIAPDATFMNKLNAATITPLQKINGESKYTPRPPRTGPTHVKRENKDII